MSDVEIVVGIRGDDSGGRVIKRSLDDISASADKTVKKVQPIIGTMNDLAATANKTGSAVQKAFDGANFKTYENAFKGISEQIKTAETSSNKLSFATAGTTRELIVLGREALTGNFSRIPGSLIVMTERMGNLGKVTNSVASTFTSFFNPVTAAISLGVLALGAFYIAANDAKKALNEISVSFSAHGNSSLFNTEDITKYIDALNSLSGVSKGDAVKAEQALAGVLDLTKQRLNDLNSILPDVAAGLGKSVPDAAKVLADAMNDPVSAAKKLNEEFHLLTPAQNEALRSMEALGDKSGEQAILIQALTDKFKGLQEQGLSPLQGFIQSVSQAWDNASQAATAYFNAQDKIAKQAADYSAAHIVTGAIKIYDIPAMEAASLKFKDLQQQQQQLNSQVISGETIADGLNLKADQLNKLKGNLLSITNAETAALKLNANADVARFETAKTEINARMKSINDNSTAGKEAKLAAEQVKKEQDEITKAISGSETQQEKLNAEIAKLQGLKAFATSAEQVELLNRGIRNTQAELAKVQLQVELDSPLAKNFKNIADEVQRDFKDAFKSAFDGGGSLFKKFADGIKATFKSLLLDLAYQAAIKPIVISVLGAGGSMAGLSSAAIATILGTASKATAANGYATTASGGASSSGLGGIASTASGLYSAGKSFLTGTSITAGLAQYGAKASALLGGSFAQNMAVQKFITNAGTFSNLAAGAIGGIGANLLGLGNKNAYINGALSTIGGLVGSLGGPVGTFAGSFIGTALGGLFGGAKPSDKSQSGTIDFSTLAQSTSGMTGKKYSAENASYRDTIIKTISDDILAIQSAGGSASGSANITIGNRDGLRYNGQNFGTNSTAFQSAIFSDLKNSITGLDTTFQTIINKVGLQDSATLTSAFQFGTQYEATLNPKSVADDLADAIKVLDTNMQSLIDTATNLGLPIDQYTIALKKQEDAAIGALKAQAAGFSSLEEMTKTFKSFLDGEALSDSSSLSPTQKLSLAQSNFGDLLGKAQGGDLSVTQDLISAASTLIDLGRGIYASSVSFVSLEDFVRSSVSGIARAAGVPGYAIGTGSAASGMAMVGENGPELVRMRGGEQVMTAGQTAGIMALSGNASNDIVRSNAQIAGLLQDQNDETKANRVEMVRLRKSFDRLASNMKVNG